MRRKDKEITDPIEIAQIIQTASYATLSMADNGKPYAVPLNYGYRDGIFYFHSAAVGRKVEILRENPNVCLSIVSGVELKESQTACNWSVKYSSVFTEGTVVEVADPMEKETALKIIMEHYSTKPDWAMSREAISKVRVYRMDVAMMSGKKSG